MNAEIRSEKISGCVSNNKETRKDFSETFASIGKILFQVNSAKDIVKSTPGFDELFSKAKAYSQYLAMKRFECRNCVDFRFEIDKAIEAIECYQSEIRQGRDGDEWLKTARERIRGVNERLKGWCA